MQPQVRLIPNPGLMTTVLFVPFPGVLLAWQSFSV